MGSIEKKAGIVEIEMFEVGPCPDAYTMGFLIGQRFSNLIRSRLAKDLILQNQLLPFAQTTRSQPLLKALADNNRNNFPRYWNELLGTAAGSGVPFLHILLINFRKEIQAFIHKPTEIATADCEDDCSDVLVVSDSMAIAAHYEDANVPKTFRVTAFIYILFPLLSYLIKGKFSSGLSCIAYTYAGELPSCAFGFNSHGLAFTLNSVPPNEDEIVAGGIGRNFISRHLLEATGINDALDRIQSLEVSVGHSYNLMEVRTRRIVNVEAASRKRCSIYEVGEKPFFHANMYAHLPINQVQDESSLSRQKRAANLEKKSQEDFLSLLGDAEDMKYPIYMTGPTLFTLCTAVIDLDKQTLSIIVGNPKSADVTHLFPLSLNELDKQHGHSFNSCWFTSEIYVLKNSRALVIFLANKYYNLHGFENKTYLSIQLIHWALVQLLMPKLPPPVMSFIVIAKSVRAFLYIFSTDKKTTGHIGIVILLCFIDTRFFTLPCV